MFDVLAALQELDGQMFDSGQDLRTHLKRVVKDHIRELPIDFGPEDLFLLVRKNDWLRDIGSCLKLILPK